VNRVFTPGSDSKAVVQSSAARRLIVTRSGIDARI
jgi:hypothetical protein